MLDRCLIFHGHCGFQIALRCSPIQSFLESFITNNSLGFVLIESIKKKKNLSCCLKQSPFSDLYLPSHFIKYESVS